MASARGQWLEVSRKSPCSICGKGRWCSRSVDGRALICHWQGGAGAIERRDCNGGVYYVHFQSDASPRREAPALPPRPEAERADTADLNRVYGALLMSLGLESRHRQNLRQRGLNDSEIQHRGYRTMPQTGRFRIAYQLVKRFGPDLCAKIPGFIQREGKRGLYWTLSGKPGLLIPVRNFDRAITGLIVRPDEANEGRKYLWFSSSSQNGPKALASIHAPSHSHDTKIIRLTEGVLKADVATVLSGTLTLGLPGVGPWRPALSTCAANLLTRRACCTDELTEYEDY